MVLVKAAKNHLVRWWRRAGGGDERDGGGLGGISAGGEVAVVPGLDVGQVGGLRRRMIVSTWTDRPTATARAALITVAAARARAAALCV